MNYIQHWFADTLTSLFIIMNCCVSRFKRTRTYIQEELLLAHRFRHFVNSEFREIQAATYYNQNCTSAVKTTNDATGKPEGKLPSSVELRCHVATQESYFT